MPACRRRWKRCRGPSATTHMMGCASTTGRAARAPSCTTSELHAPNNNSRSDGNDRTAGPGQGKEGWTLLCPKGSC
eukprot:353237-Chlamydomonas_euryale.AAC.8